MGMKKISIKWSNGFWLKLSKHKYLEVEYFVFPWRTFNITAGWVRKQDHGGPYISIIILNFDLQIKIYDNRHWDSENNTWEKEGYHKW